LSLGTGESGLFFSGDAFQVIDLSLELGNPFRLNLEVKLVALQVPAKFLHAGRHAFEIVPGGKWLAFVRTAAMWRGEPAGFRSNWSHGHGSYS
jgi:hypothetical protein